MYFLLYARKQTSCIRLTHVCHTLQWLYVSTNYSVMFDNISQKYSWNAYRYVRKSGYFDNNNCHHCWFCHCVKLSMIVVMSLYFSFGIITLAPHRNVTRSREWIKVRNIDLSYRLKRWQILMFYIVFEHQRVVHISATRCPIEMGFRSKCSTLYGHMIYTKEINIECCQHVTHSPWSYHKYLIRWIKSSLISHPKLKKDVVQLLLSK